jgi:hypothetical protein
MSIAAAQHSAIANMAVAASVEAGDLRMKVAHTRIGLVSLYEHLVKFGLMAEAKAARRILEGLE